MNHGNARPIIRYYVCGPIGRAQPLTSNQNYVDQLAQETEPEGAQLEQADCVIAQIEAIDTEHAQEYGEEKGRLKTIAITAD